MGCPCDNFICQEPPSTTTSTSTTKTSTTVEKYFQNWRDDLFTTKKEFRLMATAVGFQLIFAFFLTLSCLLLVVYDGSGSGKLVYLFLFCLLTLPAFVSSIVGFVSLYYEIQLFNDAVLSFKIYQAFAILTTINLSTVTYEKHTYNNNHTITTYLRLSVISYIKFCLFFIIGCFFRIRDLRTFAISEKSYYILIGEFYLSG